MIPCLGTHGSRRRINNKLIREVLIAKAYSYIVQFKPYQAAKKGKQVASSAKWGLRRNVVLLLRECLTPTFSFDLFMDNYFTSFRLLNHLGVNNIRAGVLNKYRLRKCTIYFEQRTSRKKQCNFDKNHSRVVYIASSESCKPERFVRYWNKVERKYILVCPRKKESIS